MYYQHTQGHRQGYPLDAQAHAAHFMQEVCQLSTQPYIQQPSTPKGGLPWTSSLLL